MRKMQTTLRGLIDLFYKPVTNCNYESRDCIAAGCTRKTIIQ